MSLLTRLRAAAVAGALLAAAAAPVPPANQRGAIYFPVQVGTKWVYKVGDREDALVVTKVEEGKGGKLVSVGREEGHKIVPAMRVLVAEAGVYEVEVAGVTFDPPRCVLKLPAKKGDSWKREPQPDDNGVKGVATVAGVEEVATPAGKYDAIRVDWEFAVGKQKKQTASFWYAPGVGLVRNVFRTEDGEDDAILQAFTLPKR